MKPLDDKGDNFQCKICPDHKSISRKKLLSHFQTNQQKLNDNNQEELKKIEDIIKKEVV